MSIVKLVGIMLFYYIFHKSIGIMIGHLPESTYVPLSSSSSLPISYSFLHSCQECLCRAVTSTSMSFVAINCLTTSHVCKFYTSYAANYSLKSDSTTYLYLLRALPDPAVIITTKVTTVQTSTMEVTTMPSTTVTSTIPGPCSPPSSGYITMFANTLSNYQFYSYLITAQYTGDTNLKFIFQGSSQASWHLDDISLKISNESHSELLVNGNFESYSDGWISSCGNECVSSSSGLLSMDGCHSGSMCFVDMCTQAYDFLSQNVYLTSGNVYNLSFWLYLNEGGGTAPRAYVSLQ